MVLARLVGLFSRRSRRGQLGHGIHHLIIRSIREYFGQWRRHARHLELLHKRSKYVSRKINKSKKQTTIAPCARPGSSPEEPDGGRRTEKSATSPGYPLEP